MFDEIKNKKLNPIKTFLKWSPWMNPTDSATQMIIVKALKMEPDTPSRLIEALIQYATINKARLDIEERTTQRIKFIKLISNGNNSREHTENNIKNIVYETGMVEKISRARK